MKAHNRTTPDTTQAGLKDSLAERPRRPRRRQRLTPSARHQLFRPTGSSS